MLDSQKFNRGQRTIWRECGGLSWAYASEIVAAKAQTFDASNYDLLAIAIRNQWPRSKPAYLRMIWERYALLYKAIPREDAIRAVRLGYSSPAAAMNAHVIKRRKYTGFPSDQNEKDWPYD